MLKYLATACLILSGILLFSFSDGNTKKIKNSEIAGFWIVEGPSNPDRPSDIKVFEKNGNFYNLSFANGQGIITHNGKFKILDETRYKETVTHQRFNGKYALKNNEFINNYELSKDKKRLVLSGIVFSKNGGDTLKWSHVYKRVEIPE
jgi:hypothetical protein